MISRLLLGFCLYALQFAGDSHGGAHTTADPTPRASRLNGSTHRELLRGSATVKIRFLGDGPTDAHVTTGV